MTSRSDLDRRSFLRYSAGAAAALLPGVARAATPAGAATPRPARATPKVVIVRFGGGVRRQESIDPDGTRHAPYLLERLLPQGTLWRDMMIEGHPTHSTGTINITSGKYDYFMDYISNDQLIPSAPTIFELARRDLGLPMSEALVVNNGFFTEQVGWSDAEGYGAELRPGLLSMPELIRFMAEREANLGSAAAAQLSSRLEHVERTTYRAIGPSWDERIHDFWERHHRALWRNQKRGNDHLVLELTLRALRDLRPRLLMVHLQDVDYVHWGVPYFYGRGLRNTDEYTYRIFEALRNDPFYRDDTYFLVVPDCGRDSNRSRYLPYQHHVMSDVCSHQVFLFAAGPDVPRGGRVDRSCQQVDVAPTVGSLLGFTASHWEGAPLSELLT